MLPIMKSKCALHGPLRPVVRGHAVVRRVPREGGGRGAGGFGGRRAGATHLGTRVGFGR